MSTVGSILSYFKTKTKKKKKETPPFMFSKYENTSMWWDMKSICTK
jgi:hypothetical protein